MHFSETYNSDINWEEILENAVRSDKKFSDYTKIDPNKEKYKNYVHCSHVLIFARSSAAYLNEYEKKGIVLMHLRFDGFLGFPGGIVDEGENPIQALNRELREELGWFEENGPIKEEHYMFAHANDNQHKVFHFYAIELVEDKIKEIELSVLQAQDYGEEVLGVCRIPLYTMSDSYSGFPSFLCNNFIGNSKIQLIEALVILKILSVENVMHALNYKL